MAIGSPSVLTTISVRTTPASRTRAVDSSKSGQPPPYQFQTLAAIGAGFPVFLIFATKMELAHLGDHVAGQYLATTHWVGQTPSALRQLQQLFNRAAVTRLYMHLGALPPLLLVLPLCCKPGGVGSIGVTPTNGCKESEVSLAEGHWTH